MVAAIKFTTKLIVLKLKSFYLSALLADDIVKSLQLSVFFSLLKLYLLLQLFDLAFQISNDGLILGFFLAEFRCLPQSRVEPRIRKEDVVFSTNVFALYH